MQVSESIYDLMGSEAPADKKVDKLFTRMDLNGDGIVSKEEFVSYCINTNNVRQSMEFLPWIVNDKFPFLKIIFRIPDMLAAIYTT